MKVLSTDGLTKLIQLIKNSFISVDNTVTTNTATLATVATSGSYNDLSDKPIIATSVSASSTNAETVGAKLFYDTYNDFGEQLATKTDMLQASGAGMPSNRYIDLTLGASGTAYTAPADGWVVITASKGRLVRMSSSSMFVQAPDSSSVTGLFCPVVKNDKFYLLYSEAALSESWCKFSFYYAKGSEPST